VSARTEWRAAIEYPTRNKHDDTRKGGGIMEKKFIRAEEVAKELDVSTPYAYKIIHKLNDELKEKGFITIAGRVNRRYFNERLYGAERNDVDAGI
jgi:hypothetical protein